MSITSHSVLQPHQPISTEFSRPAHPADAVRLNSLRPHPPTRPHWPRSVRWSDTLAGLEQIFDQHTHLCILRRPRPNTLAQWLAQHTPGRCVERAELIDSREPHYAQLLRDFPLAGREVLEQELTELVELFAALSDSHRVGVRISVLHQPQCPRFHVDRVPLRLLCTWQGPGTEWLDNGDVNRRYLGAGSGGVPDLTSGLLLPGAVIHRMQTFEVALCKGERWPGNTGRGIVHRSPAVPVMGPHRVIVTLDEAD